MSGMSGWLFPNADYWREASQGIAGGFADEMGSRLANAGKGSGQAVADIINDFFKHFKFAPVGSEFGNEMGRLIENMATPINKGVGDAFGDLYSNLSWAFVKYAAPTILGYGVLATAIPLAIQYSYHRLIHNLGRPRLAIEQRTVTMFTPLIDGVRDRMRSIWHALVGRAPGTAAPAVFNEEVSRRIAEIIAAIPNIQRNGGYFQNVILYGPGGTGKTMISRLIARGANVNYVMISGGDLPQYIKRGEHVTELNHLFDKVEKSSRPTIIFIDEAESLAKERGRLEKPELVELQNAFLSRTGTPSNKVMIIMATNRIEDIDPAVLDRMDIKMHIGPPALQERVVMLSNYIPQFFSNAEIDAQFATAQVQAIAQRIAGFSGRKIFKMLNAIACKRDATPDRSLTESMIHQTVNDFVKQEYTGPAKPATAIPK